MSWSPQMRQSIGPLNFGAGYRIGSDKPGGVGGASFKGKPAAKNWGNRVAWEMGMAMTRVFGRRQKSLAS